MKAFLVVHFLLMGDPWVDTNVSGIEDMATCQMMARAMKDDQPVGKVMSGQPVVRIGAECQSISTDQAERLKRDLEK